MDSEESVRGGSVCGSENPSSADPENSSEISSAESNVPGAPSICMTTQRQRARARTHKPLSLRSTSRVMIIPGSYTVPISSTRSDGSRSFRNSMITFSSDKDWSIVNKRQPSQGAIQSAANSVCGGVAEFQLTHYRNDPSSLPAQRRRPHGRNCDVSTGSSCSSAGPHGLHNLGLSDPIQESIRWDCRLDDRHLLPSFVQHPLVAIHLAQPLVDALLRSPFTERDPEEKGLQLNI
jgi:hypothetical protein